MPGLCCYGKTYGDCTCGGMLSVWTAQCPRCGARSWLDHEPHSLDVFHCDYCEGQETPDGGRWTRTRIRLAED